MTTEEKAFRRHLDRAARKAARTAGFLGSGGLKSIVPPVVEETAEGRVSTGARMRGASTARRVHRRIVCIAEAGIALACRHCGGRGVQTPQMVLDGTWPPVGSPCDSPGCGGVIEEITIEQAATRLAAEISGRVAEEVKL